MIASAPDDDSAVRATATQPQRSDASTAHALEVLVGQPIDDRITAACRAVVPRVGGPRLTRLGVSSSVRGEGRTSIATGMAIVQGREYGRSTVLVDMDLDRPCLASLFGIEKAPGLADVLDDRETLDTVLQPVGDGIVVMPAGGVDGAGPRLATGLLDSHLLSELSDRFDVIVADLPPLLGSGSGAILAALFDPLLLVVRANVTLETTVRRAMSLLVQPSDPVVLLNATRSCLPRWLRRLVTA